MNYLLNQVDKSGGITKIDNIMELLLDDDFTDTKEYAELLLKEIPNKKRYDLLMDLYRRRTELPQHKLKHFLSMLFASLSKVAKSDFVRIVSSNMMRCKNDSELRMYCHYFMIDTYAEIDRLAQLRMEDLIHKSIRAGEAESFYDDNRKKIKCNSEGSLSTWINDKLDFLSNKKQIVETLFRKLNGNYSEQLFVFSYFERAISKKASDYSEYEVNTIKRQLKNGNKLFFDWIFDYIELWDTDEYSELFGTEYEQCKKELNLSNDDELPF